MRHFTALDVIVLLAYLGATTLLGIWLGRDQKTARDYFVADPGGPSSSPSSPRRRAR